MIHTAKTQNDMKHLCAMPGYFIFNLWFIVSWLAFLGNLQWVILQYDYNVNTTVLKLLYPTNSKAQHYKANGHISIALFLMKNKNKSNTQKKKEKKEGATLCIGSKPHICTVSKSGDYPEADYDKHLSPVQMISHGHFWA